MVGFGAFADGGVFDFDEVADVYIVSQFGLRTQAGVRADSVVFADFAAFEVGEGGDFAVCADFGVFDDAVCADFDVVAEFDFTFDDDVDVNHDILSVFQTAPQIETRRIAQGHACFEQFLRLFGLEDAFEFGELAFIVHAGGEVGGAHSDGADFDAVGNGFGDEVG